MLDTYLDESQSSADTLPIKSVRKTGWTFHNKHDNVCAGTLTVSHPSTRMLQHVCYSEAERKQKG